MLEQNFRRIASWESSGLLVAADEVLAAGSKKEFRVHLCTTFGRELWMGCSLSCFQNNQIRHLLLMVEDVSELVQAQANLEARERDFRTLLGNVPDIMSRHDLDGRITYANQHLAVAIGRIEEELVGRMLSDLCADGAFDELEKAVQRVVASGVAIDFEQVLTCSDTSCPVYEVRISPEPGADGMPVGALLMGRDITSRRIAEQQLRLAASVFQNTREGIVVTDGDAVILSVNPAFTEMTGYSGLEAIGRKTSLLRSDHHEPAFYAGMWQALKEEGHWQGEIWNRRKDGEAYLEWLTVDRIEAVAGTPVRYVSVFHDITELRQKDERIRYMAFHDALTGLPNRALFQERLVHALQRLQRQPNGRLSVTFIDLDGFKEVNDTLGHDVGDLLLQEVACRILGRLRRGTDTVARLGGDEFVVLMEDLEARRHCACLADEIIGCITQPMVLNGLRVSVGASMGIAFFPEDGLGAQELMKRADIAMYAAKQAGKGVYRFFSSEMLLPKG